MTTTTAAVSVGSNVATDAAAPLRQWSTTLGKDVVNANVDVKISVSQLLHWGITATMTGAMS